LAPIDSVTRIIVTHYHPDHAGNAAWLCNRYGAELWMTQGEYLTAHAVRTSGAGYTTDAVLEVFRKNGLDAERAARMRGPRNRYAELVPEFPLSYRRIIEGDEISIGKNRWRAIVGHGHAPEHLSLFSKELNTVIAGDMLLSTISTNVSVWSIDPEGDPLRLFLDSIARYRELPDDVLVLPSHGKPFRGAHRASASLRDTIRPGFRT
jgi:glyoxylase-like metal-dependent hydrolase (beta-lactamase superfamily II)